MIGQETGVLYQYETSSGIQWKTFGNEKLQPKYEGQITFGEPNGQGTLTFPDGRKYVGEFKDEEMWTGKFYDNNGNIEGKMLNGIID